MQRALRSDRASMATWSVVDAEVRDEMAEGIKHSPDARKWAHYLPIYESVVDRTRPVRMLEIGSFYRDSLQMWREYLHPDSLIVGTDISAKLVKIADPEGIHVRIGGGQNVSFLREVAAEFGPFDIVLDAGSLTSSHMVDSFRWLFVNALSNSGVYLTEDVYCDYWMFFNRFSFTDLGGGLIDAVYGHYQIATSETNFRVSPLVVARRAAPEMT